VDRLTCLAGLPARLSSPSGTLAASSQPDARHPGMAGWRRA